MHDKKNKATGNGAPCLLESNVFVKIVGDIGANEHQ